MHLDSFLYSLQKWQYVFIQTGVILQDIIIQAKFFELVYVPSPL